MYDKNQPTAARRSSDEFLRRMRSGEFSGRSLPTMNRPTQAPTQTPSNSSNGSNSCNQNSCNGGNSGAACPGDTGNAAMPSLAMVYAPVQEWRCLLSPQDALSEGTMFRELIKPFRGRTIYRPSH